MNALERRGWCDAAVDALALRGTGQGGGPIRMLAALVHDGDLPKDVALSVCRSRQRNAPPASKKTVSVYASQIRQVLTRAGFPGAFQVTATHYVLDRSTRKLVDLMVREKA